MFLFLILFSLSFLFSPTIVVSIFIGPLLSIKETRILKKIVWVVFI